MNPGTIIASAREAAGLSQADLADLADMDPSVLSRIENGKVNVEPGVYQRLSRALSKTLDQVALVEAIGYPVPVSGEARLPRELVALLRQLQPDDWAVIDRLARGLLQVPASQSRTEAQQARRARSRARRPTGQNTQVEAQP